MLHRISPLLFAVIAATSTAQPVPAEFVHDRIYVVAPAPDGSTIRFYTDSGGGWNAIGKSAADRLKLPVAGEIEGEGKTYPLVDFPAFARLANIPAPSLEPWLKGRLVVAPDAMMMGADGFLGTRWFAGHVWQIDYPAQTLAVLPAWKPNAGDHAAPLGFHHGPDGQRDLDFPRVQIVVDGKPIDVLLDTGATAQLTGTAAGQFGLPPGTQTAASYAIKSIFDGWHAKHPDWRVIDAADAVVGHAFPMIEVPQVTIAGVAFGPVWFTQRPDVDFHNALEDSTDKPVDGAIGGSGLKYLRVVLDYPAGVAYFHANQSTAASHR